MSQNVWGYWDCPYCETKKIRGDNTHCPNCAAPVEPGTKFYMDKEDKLHPDYVPEEQKKTEANWECLFCHAQNGAELDSCPNCGTHKGEAEPPKPKEEKPPEPVKKVEEEPPPPPAPVIVRRRRGNFLKRLKAWMIFLTICAAVFAVAVWLNMPVMRKVKITKMSWSRSVSIEEFKGVEESGWTLPKDAVVVSSSEEIKEYKKVIDHYETKEKEFTETILDGYDTDISYNDLGNGQFEQVEVQKPRYRTEYRYETYDEPVYKEEPVYATKYVYTIDKWVQTRSVNTMGEDHDPKWGDLTLDDNEREAGRKQSYIVTVNHDGEEYDIELKYDVWDSYNVGDYIEYEATRLNDDPVEGIGRNPNVKTAETEASTEEAEDNAA